MEGVYSKDFGESLHAFLYLQGALLAPMDIMLDLGGAEKGGREDVGGHVSSSHLAANISILCVCGFGAVGPRPPMIGLGEEA
jgi:hypothetical protein